MIKVQIGEKEISVNPELTIARYQKIQKNPERYENTSEVLALYLDIDVKQLKSMPVDKIKFVEGLLTQHIMKPKADDIVLSFNYKGVNYGFENDWQNMTWGQWVDLEVFSQPDKIVDNIHILMALLYRPIILQEGGNYTLEKFDSDKVMERAKLFLDIPVNYWFGCATFFLLISSEFIKDIETSLKLNQKLNRYLKPMMKILPKWLHPKVPQDSILNYHSRLLEMTSQKSDS